MSLSQVLGMELSTSSRGSDQSLSRRALAINCKSSMQTLGSSGINLQSEVLKIRELISRCLVLFSMTTEESAK